MSSYIIPPAYVSLFILVAKYARNLELLSRLLNTMTYLYARRFLASKLEAKSTILPARPSVDPCYERSIPLPHHAEVGVRLGFGWLKL